MTDAALLPSNATPAERAIAGSIARISDVPVPLRTLWDPATIPVALLPWLAWTLGIGPEWALAETEAERRALVAGSFELHKHKGTPYAIRRGLILAGFLGAEVREGEVRVLHDSQHRRDRTENYNAGARWALFSVVIDLGETRGFVAATAARARLAIGVWKNARSHLHHLGVRATLVEDRQPPPAAEPDLHAGLHLLARRTGLRDGTVLRATPHRHLHNDESIADGTVPRDGGITWTGLRFGPAKVRPLLHAGFHFALHRVGSLVRDGTIRFDAAFRRDYEGALDRGGEGNVTGGGWPGLLLPLDGEDDVALLGEDGIEILGDQP